ncbi:TrlF family AAA-like ATPase [Alteromonas sp. KUL106]|uniref:TrlF family AAA-like ATPase n=1 Tax=Alteromonas sp. KUL106 TaxID=2480799 RepID=UPI0012E5041B|nr:AAA family ATPase [Alteromonas sp. KUL106]GFD68922.1 DNA repair ATPase [Alteromonas sp. KUL106]
MEKFARGAEWRKWDLHVHTPASLYQNYGSDDVAWETFVSDLESLPSEFAVIGINDYLFIEGYEKLKTIQENQNRLQNIKLLPVLEFRIEKFAGVDFGSHKRINLHVIFSDEVPVETITSQFLNTLEQSYTLESGEKWTRVINKNSVEELGARIKQGVPEGQLGKYQSNLVEGFNNLNIDEKQIFSALDKDCFKGKFLIAVGKTEWAALKWSDSSIATKKSIINNANIVFTAISTREEYIKSKNQLTKQKVNDRLLDCSDAHYYSESQDKDRIGNSLTWIKADPTFDGLVHAIEEFEERIFVGDEPELFERVTKNKTKYIDTLEVSSVDGYSDPSNVWFEHVNIPLNHELVAIIGNKGSGKSAVADIIALCSNHYDDDDFSFLTSKKFKEKKGKIASNFRASLRWESGIINQKGLNEVPGNDSIREVKYLPQGLFERLTNEISTVEEFQKEIEGVVFSHIPDEEKLNTSSFSELVALKTSDVAKKISHSREKIHSLNKIIIDHELKATSSYKNQLASKLQQKRRELEALTSPDTVGNPNEDPEKKKVHEEANKRLEKIREEIKNLEDSIADYEKLKQELLIKKNTLGKVRASLIQKQSEIELYIQELIKDMSVFDLDSKKLISFQINTKIIDDEIEEISTQLSEISGLLDGDDGLLEGATTQKPTLRVQLENKKKELLIEKGKLDSEQQKYQSYLTALSKWEKERTLLIGDASTPGTIRYLESQIAYLQENLNSDLDILYQQRAELVDEVFKSKQEVVSLYKSARERLNSLITENSETLQNYKIEVDASLDSVNMFGENFLSHIYQNKAGSFHSKDGAEKYFKLLTTDINFDNPEDVKAFLESILVSLRKDLRDGQKKASRDLREQVRDVQKFYDYLFGLEFLTYNYQLKQGGKGIDQLSPGERGALLLVFYLLLDKNNVPLIIDQPEDNLDNESVATILVPFIKAAKKKRQIIMVTHNPNLAIVSDAEQVIYVHLDKEVGYRFTAESGSIENKDINKRIVNVLEGAMPAFNTRKRKYFDDKTMG